MVSCISLPEFDGKSTEDEFGYGLSVIGTRAYRFGVMVFLFTGIIRASARCEHRRTLTIIPFIPISHIITGSPGITGY